MPEHRSCLTRTQHAAVIDAIRAKHHRRHQRHHLAPRVRCPVPIAKRNRRIHQRFDPEPPREHRRQQHTRIRDRPLVIKHDPRSSGRPFTMQVTPWRRTRSRWHGPSCLRQEVI